MPPLSAQTTNPLPATGPAAELQPALIDEAPLERPRRLTEPEVVPLISFDADFPLIDVLNNLAQQSGINFTIAPELITNGAPVELLRQPVGSVQFENVTARQALDNLLARKNLMLGTLPGGSMVYLGTLDSGMTPLEREGGDLAKMTGDEELQMENFLDPNKEIPLLTAIQILSRLSKINVMVDPRVKSGGIRQVGTNIVELPPVATNTVVISTYGGVTPRQTLDAVLNNYGLTMVQDRNTGFYQVTFRDPSAKEPVYPFTVPLRYSNTTNIQTLIQVTFPSARVQSDPRTAQLVVLATEREYEAITNLVASLDLPTRQVLIEARFLETFTNPKSLKGIDWTDTLQAQRFTAGNGTLSGGSSQTTTRQSPGDPITVTRPDGTTTSVTPGSSTSTTRTDTRNTSFDSTAISLSTAGGFSPNMAFLNAQGVNAVLSFLNSESDSRVLATPRAVTLDNQETKLEVTTAIPIFNASESIGQAGVTTSSSRPEYTNVGTILVVTPRITGSNVSMRLRPEISRVVPDHPSGRKIVQGKVNEADVFSSSTIETSVLVPSGNTLVMGGLISDSSQKTYTKVPILGDIPGLGWAFRKESKSREKANLIVFVTPTIIDTEDFQPYRTEFLNTPMPEHDGGMPNAWNRGKPWAKVVEEEQGKTSQPSN
jgi:Flp pilus assembly secretin CpaC